MNEERAPIVAGSLIPLSLAPYVEAAPIFISEYILLLNTFFGLNLLQRGYSQVCALNNFPARFGVKSSC